MIPYERRLQMLRLLEQTEIVSLDDFCRELQNVSESTIRRDLKTLEAEGQITMLKGGGACLKKGSFDTPVNSKTITNVSEKEKIARYAASLVKDGEAIYLDAGSTVLRMIKYLKDRQITVVTTNLLVLQAMQENNIDDRSAHCIMAGGEVKISTASVVGTATNNFLRTCYFDKAFVGTSGISAIAGFNTPDIREAEKKKIVKNNSTETYVLADSSKSGITTLCKFYELGEVTVICNEATDVIVSNGNYIIAN